MYNMRKGAVVTRPSDQSQLSRLAEDFTTACEERREDDALNLLQINSRLYTHVFNKGKTSLHLAVENDNIKLVQHLLLHGVSPDVKDNQGKTSLHYGAERGHKAIVQLLLTSGASVLKKDKQRKTSLHYAANAGQTDISLLFLMNGASVDEPDARRKTSIHYAAEKGHKDIIQLFALHANSSICDKDEFGKTSLHYAAENGHTDIVKHLIQNGIELEDVDDSGIVVLEILSDKYGSVGLGLTALDLARNTNEQECVRVLIECGVLIPDDDKVGESMDILQNKGLYNVYASLKEITRKIFLKHIIFLSSKHGNYTILKEACIIVKQEFNEYIEMIIRKDSTVSELLSKNPLDYCMEKGDKRCIYEILSLEAEIHKDLPSGLLYLKENVAKCELKKWIVETYCGLYKEQQFCSPWISAIFIVFLELGIFSYGIALYDFYSDYQMMHEYANHSQTGWEIVGHNYENFTAEDHDHGDIKETFHIAHCTTTVVIIGSALAYFINVGLSHTSPIIKKIWDVHNNTNFITEIIYEIVYCMFKLLFWPIIHIVNSIQYTASDNKILFEERNEELNNSWKQVKIWEQGVENTVQLGLSIWTLRHHLPCMIKLGMQGIIKDSMVGLENFLLFGAVEANYIQKTLGKSVMAFMFLAFSLSWMKNDKRGYSLVEKLTRMIPLFAAYIIQISTRLIALICVIFLQTDFGHIKFAIAVSIHAFIVIIILVTFESQITEIQNAVDSQKNAMRKLWIVARRVVSLLMRVLSSTFHLPSCNHDIDCKHTFISQSCYQIVLLVENLAIVLTLKLHPELFPEKFTSYLWTDHIVCITVFGWLASVILRIIHYRYSHPWGMINGPTWTDGLCKVKTKLCWKKELLDITCPVPICLNDILSFELNTKRCTKLKLNKSCLPFFIHTNDSARQSDKHDDQEQNNCYKQVNYNYIAKEEDPKHYVKQDEEPYVYPIKYWQHHSKQYPLEDIPEQESEPEEEKIEIIVKEDESDKDNLSDEDVFVGYRRTEL